MDNPEDTSLLKHYGFKEEIGEEQLDHFVPTGFPDPIHRYRLMWENFNLSIEEAYFWIHGTLNGDWGFVNIVKTKDLFTASENSSFFGTSQQRLGAQQDKVSQYLAVIGKMVKELFQIVRELRIIDEKLGYYYNALGIYRDNETKLYSKKGKLDHASEVTLKGIWIDLVEQGAKNPASVYGMARDLQFTTLPDLFFNAPSMKSDHVSDYIKTLDFNRKVKEVLARKLKTFIRWKETTFDEIKNRRLFTLKYLWQHFDVIKMYMSWVRPYLANIRRMHMDIGKAKSADLISAFEGSIIEIEFLALQLPQDMDVSKQNEEIYACVLAHFWYRTRPTMSYQQEYQRGPVHIGKVVFTLRSYTWNREQIDSFLEYRDRQDFELMKSVSGSVEAAMKALGGDLEKYLKEAGRREYERIETPESKSSKGPTVVSGNPFMAVLGGVGDVFKAFMPAKKVLNKDGKVPLTKDQIKGEKAAAKAFLKTATWEAYKNFKKSHGMIAW